MKRIAVSAARLTGRASAMQKTWVSGGARYFSSTDTEPTVESFLAQKGYTDPQIVKGMLAVFPKPSVKELTQFGDNGLAALSAAVIREVEKNAASEHLPNVTIYVRSAHGGEPMKLVGKEGQTFIQLQANNRVLADEMECACGGIAACSTCHIIFKQSDFAKVPGADDAEVDMLDLTEDLTDTSRLGCQVYLTAALDGVTVQLPKEVRNLH